MRFDYRATCTADHVSAFSPRARLLFFVTFSRGSSCSSSSSAQSSSFYSGGKVARPSHAIASGGYGFASISVPSLCVHECVIYLKRASGFCTRRGRLARSPIVQRMITVQNDLKTRRSSRSERGKKSLLSSVSFNLKSGKNRNYSLWIVLDSVLQNKNKVVKRNEILK